MVHLVVGGGNYQHELLEAAMFQLELCYSQILPVKHVFKPLRDPPD